MPGILLDAGKGFVPLHLAPARPFTYTGPPKTVGVFVELSEGSSLGAEIATTEDVVAVAADAFDRFAAHRQRQPASRFAERAGPKHRPCRF